MTLSGYFMLKSVFGQQGCRSLTFALARLSCYWLQPNFKLNKCPYSSIARPTTGSDRGKIWGVRTCHWLLQLDMLIVIHQLGADVKTVGCDC